MPTISPECAAQVFARHMIASRTLAVHGEADGN